MSGDYHFGDRIYQVGNYNTGTNRVYGSGIGSEAHSQLLSAVRELRTQVSDQNQRLIDEHLPALEAAEQTDPSRLHRALTTVAGVASLAGAVGLPVLEAVQQFVGALGG
ncbi:hypothetical protein [Streptomyces sp. NPDC006134]|uniref:hypothetical protein n=1 Tax=Streptomyces sp. NPDC006134 TaxID=3154467 RepID=UPI0033C05910